MLIYFIAGAACGYLLFRWVDAPTGAIRSRKDDAKNLIPLLDRRGFHLVSEALNDWVDGESLVLERLKSALRKFQDDDQANQIVLPVMVKNAGHILQDEGTRAAFIAAARDAGWAIQKLDHKG